MTFPNKDSFDLSNFLSGYKSEIKKGLDFIDVASFEIIANVLETTIIKKNTIFTCGNGGSLAVADHFVCDFIKGSSTDTTIKPIIYSLGSNTPTLSAIANDISYKDIFSYQLDNYGKKGDVLLSVSSSGNSPNIIEAISMAKKKGMKTISFVGFMGGKAKQMSDNYIHIQSKNYGIVEDIHHSLMHMLAQYIRIRNLKNKLIIDDTIF